MNGISDKASGTRDFSEDIKRLMPDLALLQRCGAGGYGAVYMAQDATGRYLAVKYTLFDDQSGAEREQAGLNYFCRKMRGMQNLIAVHHVVANGKELCYTMDLADDFRSGFGGQEDYCADTLARRIVATPRMPLSEIVRYARQLMDAVEALHAEGLVHRDIKPANILFVNKTLKLGDVGLVSQVADEPSLVGTPPYMPPEMRPTAGEAPAGSAGYGVDLYALGITLYCMMSGREAKYYPALPAQLVEQERGLSALNAFINHACDPDPGKRFANIHEFREAFEAHVGHGPTAATRRRKKRLILSLNILFGLVLVAALAVALVLWRSRRTVAAPPVQPSSTIYSQLPWWTDITPYNKTHIVVCAERADGQGTVPPGWSMERQDDVLQITLDSKEIQGDVKHDFEVYLQFSSGTSLFAWTMTAGDATLTDMRLFSSQGFWPPDTSALPTSTQATQWGLRFVFQNDHLLAYANGRQICNLESPSTNLPWRLGFRLAPKDDYPAAFEAFCLFAPSPQPAIPSAP